MRQLIQRKCVYVLYHVCCAPSLLFLKFRPQNMTRRWQSWRYLWSLSVILFCCLSHWVCFFCPKKLLVTPSLELTRERVFQENASQESLIIHIFWHDSLLFLGDNLLSFSSWISRFLYFSLVSCVSFFLTLLDLILCPSLRSFSWAKHFEGIDA